MDAQAVSLGAFVISLGSLVVAFVGLGFSARQSRHAVYATAMATTQHFMVECRALWAECHLAFAADPLDARRSEIAVGNILGHFEVVATFLADGMVEGRTTRLVAGTIRDYLDHMSDRGFLPYVQAALDTDEVCENLRAFCIQHGSEFRNPGAVFDMMKIKRSSL